MHNKKRKLEHIMEKSMKNYKKGITICTLAVLLGFLLSLISCSNNKDAITIGAVLPLTGSSASYGVYEQRGMMMAAAKINETGGINGKQIEIVYEDSKGNNQEALNAYRKLRAQGIKILFTSMTGPSKVIKPLAIKENVLQVIFGMTDDLADGPSGVFRIYPGLSEEGRIFLDYVKMTNKKNVAIFYLDNDAYNYLVSNVLLPGLNQIGVTNIIKETFVSNKLEGLKTSLQKVRFFNPDILFIISYYGYVHQILRDIKTINLQSSAQIVGGLDIPVAAFTVQDFPFELVEGVVCVLPKFMFYTYDNSYTSIEAKEFISRYKTQFNGLPTYDAAYGYDSVMVIAEAIKKSGYIDTKRITETIIGMEIEGVSGKIKILPDGNCQTDWLLTKFEDGRLSIIK